jgi:hypothetical protein
MSTKVEAVQLSTDPFYFPEYSTNESNIETTTKFITEGATRVWLRNGISVFRIASGKLLISYFAVDLGRKPWTTIYCVKVDYSAHIKPLRAACQMGVWKDVRGTAKAAGLATDIFWKILFKNHDMIADKVQTHFGYDFWSKRIREAFRYNYHVYSVRIKDEKIKNAKEITSIEQFEQVQDSIWGPDITDQWKRIVIALKPLEFASHQKPYGASAMANLKIPKAFQDAAATKTEARKKVEATAVPAEIKARVDMSAEVAGAGLCPDCRKPMIPSHANGHPVLSCTACRIVIPTKDEVTE